MSGFTFHPLTPDRWPDLEALFGPRGALGGCWCMWWRLKRSEFDAHKGEDNRRAFRQIVEEGAEPGLLAYDGGRPVGWVAVQPREAYPVLARSATLRPLDDQPAWAVTCFFVARGYRRAGLALRLLQAAVDHAARHGARLIEGYPVEPRREAAPDLYVFTGFVSTFRRAGFVEAARRSPTRPIMRLTLEGGAP